MHECQQDARGAYSYTSVLTVVISRSKSVISVPHSSFVCLPQEVLQSLQMALLLFPQTAPQVIHSLSNEARASLTAMAASIGQWQQDRSQLTGPPSTRSQRCQMPLFPPSPRDPRKRPVASASGTADNSMPVVLSQQPAGTHAHQSASPAIWQPQLHSPMPNTTHHQSKAAHMPLSAVASPHLGQLTAADLLLLVCVQRCCPQHHAEAASVLNEAILHSR